ncbi:hypothetical protein KUTeg_003951 [Tegillarca granosa]|uniref:Uncharacterized protein n=1 Tax=Tegillarca granosa TaxID=220873 RepID=A0ABQ9FNM4_TEGGR|nr:hypothetical protein KUTeg_003951 [Tegillarca granosa]
MLLLFILATVLHSGQAFKTTNDSEVGLYLENYIQSDLTNTTITVLQGDVVVEIESEKKNYSLKSGDKMQLPYDAFHNVYTVGDHPSCYMYIYINTTEVELSKKLKDYSKLMNDTEHGIDRTEELAKFDNDTDIQFIKNSYQAHREQKKEKETKGKLGSIGDFFQKKYSLFSRTTKCDYPYLLQSYYPQDKCDYPYLLQNYPQDKCDYPFLLQSYYPQDKCDYPYLLQSYPQDKCDYPYLHQSYPQDKCDYPYLHQSYPQDKCDYPYLHQSYPQDKCDYPYLHQSYPQDKCDYPYLHQSYPQDKCDYPFLLQSYYPQDKCDYPYLHQSYPQDKCDYPYLHQSYPQDKCDYPYLLQSYPQDKCDYRYLLQSYPQNKCDNHYLLKSYPQDKYSYPYLLQRAIKSIITRQPFEAFLNATYAAERKAARKKKPKLNVQENVTIKFCFTLKEAGEMFI